MINLLFCAFAVFHHLSRIPCSHLSSSSQLCIATAGAKEGDYNQLDMQEKKIKGTRQSVQFGRVEIRVLEFAAFATRILPVIESSFVKYITLVPV